MQYVGDEIKINIFKYVNYPLSLALTCRNWSVIAKDPYAKSEWLIVNYGKRHALFHAIRLGPTFIDIAVCQTLFARNIAISRYFIQKLLIYFGKYDQRLIQLKIKHNISQLYVDRIRLFQQKITSSYVNNLPISVFVYLLNEGYKQLSNGSNEDLSSKCNDIDASPHSPHVITTNHVLGKKNLKDIEDLILNKRSILLPRMSKAFHLDLLNQIHQPSKYNYDMDFLRQGSFSRYYYKSYDLYIKNLPCY